MWELGSWVELMITIGKVEEILSYLIVSQIQVHEELSVFDGVLMDAQDLVSVETGKK